MKGNTNLEKLLLSKAEAAELLSVSYPTVDRHIKAGKIPSIKLGGRCLVPRKALIKMIDDDTEQSTKKKNNT